MTSNKLPHRFVFFFFLFLCSWFHLWEHGTGGRNLKLLTFATAPNYTTPQGCHLHLILHLGESNHRSLTAPDLSYCSLPIYDFVMIGVFNGPFRRLIKHSEAHFPKWKGGGEKYTLSNAEKTAEAVTFMSICFDLSKINLLLICRLQASTR